MKWLGCVLLLLIISTEVKAQSFTGNPPGYGRGGYDERYGYGDRRYDRDRDRGYDNRGYQSHRYWHRHCAYVGNVRVCQ